jgi:molecular chaperone GrpE
MPSNEQNETPKSQTPTEAAGPNGAEQAGGGPAAAATDEVAKLTAERAELNDRLLRLAAEFENYKRRIRKESEEASLRGLESLLKEILPPLDNLDRALVAARVSDGQGLTALVEGMQLVQKQFFTALDKFQVKPLEVSPGQPFDPNFHEAVQQVESDTLPAGSVATVFQRGYVGAGKRLMRPAVVAVVRGRE